MKTLMPSFFVILTCVSQQVNVVFRIPTVLFFPSRPAVSCVLALRTTNQTLHLLRRVGHSCADC